MEQRFDFASSDSHFMTGKARRQWQSQVCQALLVLFCHLSGAFRLTGMILLDARLREENPVRLKALSDGPAIYAGL